MAASLIAIYAKAGDSLRRLSPMFYRRPLDWLNFFLADVRGGLGPYVGVFLLTQAHWNQATIGAVLTVSGLIGIALHVPIGALIDALASSAACSSLASRGPTLPLSVMVALWRAAPTAALAISRA